MKNRQICGHCGEEILFDMDGELIGSCGVIDCEYDANPLAAQDDYRPLDFNNPPFEEGFDFDGYDDVEE